jgi:hypothetical protein
MLAYLDGHATAFLRGQLCLAAALLGGTLDGMWLTLRAKQVNSAI